MSNAFRNGAVLSKTASEQLAYMNNLRGLILNPADRMQVLLAIIGPVILALPFLVSLDVVLEIGLWAVVWVLISRHNYILHNHVHRPFTRSRRLNRILNVMLGFCTGMTAGIWKIIHVHGHHVEHKLDLLPSRSYVRYLKIDENAHFSYFSALRHAVKTAPLQWILPVYIMVRESARGGKFRRKFYRFYLLEFIFIYGLVIGFFLIHPQKALFYFGIMYSLVYIISRHVCYVTHVSSHSESRYGFSNVCVHPKYNKLLWNFGFHVAHHLEPKAHWTVLPSIYRTLNVQEDETSARTVNYFGALSPAAFSWHRVKDTGGMQ